MPCIRLNRPGRVHLPSLPPDLTREIPKHRSAVGPLSTSNVSAPGPLKASKRSRTLSGHEGKKSQRQHGCVLIVEQRGFRFPVDTSENRVFCSNENLKLNSRRCFCGSTIDPKPPRLATPHSCGSPCSRSRKCGHSCPLSCHPGPCPPCQVTTQSRCYCSSKVLSFKCSNLAPTKEHAVNTLSTDLSCGNICHKELSCKNHACQDLCHPGDCKPCQIEESGRCYCGKEEKNVACGKGSPRECETQEEGKWTGIYECHNTCSRYEIVSAAPTPSDFFSDLWIAGCTPARSNAIPHH